MADNSELYPLLEKLCNSPEISKIYILQKLSYFYHINKKIISVPLSNKDIYSIFNFILKENIDFVIANESTILNNGIINLLNHYSIANIGPTKEMLLIEKSYEKFKNFISECEIPYTSYVICYSKNHAQQILINHTYPLLIKTNNNYYKNNIINSINDGIELISKWFLNNSEPIIIEEYLEGEQYETIVLTDGENILPFIFYKKNNYSSIKNYSQHNIFFSKNTFHEQLIIKTIIHPLLNYIKNKLQTKFKGIINVSCIEHNGIYTVLKISFQFKHSTLNYLLNHLKTDLHTLFIKMLTEQINTEEIKWDERSKIEILLDEFNKNNI